MNLIVRRIVTALTTATLAVLAVIYAPTGWIRPAVYALMAAAFAEYALLLRKKFPRFCPGFLLAMLLGGLVIGGLVALPIAAERHGNLMLLYLIAIVKFSDMGGFAFGLSSARLMAGGNHKMCPTISPNKSWEGLLGSVVASELMSLAFLPITHFAVGKALAFGVAAALLGTAGDLVESKFKRWVGVKDSATFMPAGLGGLLDMFDSLLIAPAALLPFV